MDGVMGYFLNYTAMDENNETIFILSSIKSNISTTLEKIVVGEDGLREILNQGKNINFMLIEKDGKKIIKGDAPHFEIIEEKGKFEMDYTPSIYDLFKTLSNFNSLVLTTKSGVTKLFSQMRVSLTSHFLGYSIFDHDEQKWSSEPFLGLDVETNEPSVKHFVVMLDDDQQLAGKLSFLTEKAIKSNIFTFEDITPHENFTVYEKKKKMYRFYWLGDSLQAIIPAAYNYMIQSYIVYIATSLAVYKVKEKLWKLLMTQEYQKTEQEHYERTRNPRVLEVKYKDNFIKNVDLKSFLEEAVLSYGNGEEAFDRFLTCNTMNYAEKKAIIDVMKQLFNQSIDLIDFAEKHRQVQKEAFSYRMEFLNIRNQLYEKIKRDAVASTISFSVEQPMKIDFIGRNLFE